MAEILLVLIFMVAVFMLIPDHHDPAIRIKGRSEQMRRLDERKRRRF